MSSHEAWFTNDMCSLARGMEIFGERWTFLVLRESFYGTRRFDDFQRNIGVARNILSDRLKTLVEHGILERRQYEEHPPRSEYRLTRKGLDLYPALLALMDWGNKHMPYEKGPPVKLQHKTCGKISRPVMVCDRCGEPIEARDMRALPGPGALTKAGATASG
jgi:DNA-binding HxlR family transcriptional regulator